MTVGKVIDILEQFPRDQILEMGYVTPDDKQELASAPIAEILINENHLIMVDAGTAELIKIVIMQKLNVRGKGNPKADDADLEEQAEQIACMIQAIGKKEQSLTEQAQTPG